MREFLGKLLQAIGILWLITFGIAALIVGIASASNADHARSVWIVFVVLALPGVWLIVVGRRMRRSGPRGRAAQHLVRHEQVLDAGPYLRTSISVERIERAPGELLLPLHDVEREFDMLNHKHRYFKPEAAAWIVPLIAQTRDEMTVRSHGGDLTKEQKKAIGISTRARFGNRYIESLTPEGMSYAQDAAGIYVMAIGAAISRRQAIQQFEAMGVKRIQLCAIRDDRTCKAALVADNRSFETAGAPVLPLEGCDAQWCRCVWVADPKSL
jgi:hypothetical protein